MTRTMRWAQSNQGPQCPFCGEIVTTDESFYFNEDGYDLDCGKCERKYAVEPRPNWIWTCTPKEGC